MKRNLKKKSEVLNMLVKNRNQLEKSLLTYEEFVNSYNIKSKQRELVKGWFPITPSAELAEIAAALMTDGHIDWNDYDESLPRPKKLVLYSNYKNECEWFLDKIHNLFSLQGKIIKYQSKTGFSKSESFKAIIYNAPLARILIAIGVPCGDKTKKGYLVPDWIMNGSNEIKKSFLRILFNFDGSISIKNKISTAEINFCFNKHQNYLANGKNFMLQIKGLLNVFNIKSGKIHIRKTVYTKYSNYDKYTFMLFISNHKSIINFYKNIGFLNRRKQGKLQRQIYAIYKNARISFNLMPRILSELKEMIGTDKEAIEWVNKYSKIKFTHRQFEHMRRGELKIPIQMVLSAIKILNKKEYFGKIPEHYRDVINIYDSFFLR